MLRSMLRAQEIEEVRPGILVWHAYDSEVKADLFSTALETPAGTWLVDPIPLVPDALRTLRARRRPVGILMTNGNHVRATAEFAEALSVPIFIHESLRLSSSFPQATGLLDAEMFSPGITALGIDGGPHGEMALYYGENEGTLVVGDALINFEPHGFGLLPKKYCLNARRMRQSLRRLLDYSFERMLFAHGTPMLAGAHTRLEKLLATTR